MNKFFKRLQLLKGISILKFVYYNFLCRNIRRHGKNYLIPYKGTVVTFGEGAKIELSDGNLFINNNKPCGSKAEAYVLLGKDARLIISGTTSLNYGATIEIHENAEVEINGAYINTGAVILAAKRISIGHGVLISRHVFIYDSDHHPIYNDEGEIANPARDIVIGEHVWIGLKCIILRGSNIGEGALIAAGSVVGGKIKPGVLAQGNPARGYSAIKWSASPQDIVPSNTQ